MRPTFKEILSAFGRFLLELPIELSSFIITPIALLFCKKEDEHLPKILAWYNGVTLGLDYVLVNKDKNARNELAKAVNQKVVYITSFEQFCVAKKR